MKNILVVEDNELNMKLFFDILTYQKHNVEKALDGLEAYKKIKNNIYDLIILDIQLPKMSGFEVLDKLSKENIKTPPIIIASACAMDEDKKKAEKHGIDSYITKPIDINSFIKCVNEKLNK